MANRKTLDFLPKIFQTETNEKFLNATLDQLVSDVDLLKLNGYIGRKFAPTYKSDNSYILETDQNRTNYQLEPSVVVSESDEIKFYSDYVDLINQLQYYGAKVNDHDRLFSSEYYSFGGLIDLDKFVNFSQYYWLPNGPDPILIGSEIVNSHQTFTITKNFVDNTYTFDQRTTKNPEITLMRGGVYKFKVSQPGSKFWIQTEPGVSGTKKLIPSIGTRDILGVTNNGEDDGVIEFFVPLANVQDRYLKMPVSNVVDFVITTVTFTELDGLNAATIDETIFGKTPLDIDGKTLIFALDSDLDADWISKTQNKPIDIKFRRSVWLIQLDRTDPQNPIINLKYLSDITEESRIYVKIGSIENAHKEFFKDTDGYLKPVPNLTAQLEELYYQDSTDSDIFGKIRLVDREIEAVNVEQDILGKKQWATTSGISLSGGMKIQFGEYVLPKQFANNTYIVEGVGSNEGISLVDYSLLVCPEVNSDESMVGWDHMNFDTDRIDQTYNGPIYPEYIVSNRSSLDLNPWARQNCWYHSSLVELSAAHNGTNINVDQSARAKRPIIEFNPSIQLFNSGSIGMPAVDHIDTTYTDAFNQVQHGKFLNLPNLSLVSGQRILFANDKDPIVRSQVYTIEYGIQDESAYKAYYDQIGTGTLLNQHVYIDFESNSAPIALKQSYDANNPNLNLDYEYSWYVTGHSNLLNAKVIEGIELAAGSPDAVVTSVKFAGNKRYLITFKSVVPIIRFINANIKIRLEDGVTKIEGTGTRFQSEVAIGSQIYNKDDILIGTVSSIHSDTLMFFEKTTSYALVNSEFKIKTPKIRLIASNNPLDIASAGSQVVAKTGVNKGLSYWYNGISWIKAQQKTSKNQNPLFDVFDENENSLGSKAQYPASDFSGTKIFSYKFGSGIKDAVLGFPLYYTTVSSTASEITFENNFNNDKFSYLQNSITKSNLISKGTLKKNLSSNEKISVSVWNQVLEKTKQYQIINNKYTGTTNSFTIDVEPSAVGISPNIKVYVNNSILPISNFELVKVNSISSIRIYSSLTIGDKIDILVYSKSPSSLGYYQIPSNLEYNSENASLLNLNFGQIRNHVAALKQNSKNILELTNLKDLDISGIGGNILQHTAPIIYSTLFLCSKQANFINALEYAKHEYSKFKNKFLEMALALLDQNQTNLSVDVILQIINQNKNDSFPWKYSDMVPYGDYKIFSYKITDVNLKQYPIDLKFDQTKLQSRAILVYFNDQLLTYGRDYIFSDILPTVIIKDNFRLNQNGLLEIKEYNTDANFIPETPTKLGLYPKFLPEIMTDYTYQKPKQIIQGHDGSLTPAFGDLRDRLLLELETRIYNNIKKNSNSKTIDHNEFIPGQFRIADYSLEEYNNILSNSFLQWVGENKLDYSTNDYVVNGDLFSYNYKSSKGKLNNQFLIGHWRGMYKFLYDTDRPHSHPWEMLGFSEKPTWWDEIYGPAPYTSNNQNLWLDLEKGIVRDGERKGIDVKYIRDGLSKIIPVDDQGALLPPTSVIISKFNSNRISENYSFGDGGPVEMAWRKSSDYPFAIQRALALMKPAFYFGTMFDVDGYFKDKKTNEYVNIQNNLRITADSIKLNGELVDSNITRSSGYLNFILEYLKSLGIDSVTTLRDLLNNVNVQLSYKMSGFTDKKYLTILAEQYSPTSTNESIIIPDENYRVYLNKGKPIEKATYSAVVVQKTQNGYSVSGYDLSNPYFIIVPSETSAGNSYTITVDTALVTVFNKYKKQKILVPYGQEFSNRQQLVDFLISYQRYLMSLGFAFEEFNQDLGEQQNWVLSVKEFLTWSLQSWKPNSILVLSPIGNKLNFYLPNTATVDSLSTENNNINILDTNFNAISVENLFINRKADTFSIQSIAGDTFALVNLNLIQYEHVLIFDNKTIFNDIIYKPELGSRQFRLKLIGSKTGQWSGSISPPGFIFNNSLPDTWKSGKDYLKGDLVKFKNKFYVATQKISAADTFNINYWKQVSKSSIKTGLLPNFSQNASKFIDVYDLDSESNNKQFRKLGAGLIGYRFKNYLSDLNIDISTQTKFYQGYIKDKGTKNSIFSLLSASNSKDSNITFDEEWAVRLSEYGAQNSNGILDLPINETDSITNNFGLVIDGDSNIPSFLSVNSQKQYKSENSKFSGFLLRNNQSIRANDIATAGYVNLEDIDFCLFDITKNSLSLNDISSIVSGMHVWVAKDLAFNWQVYRVDESNNYIKLIEYALDFTAIVTTNVEHGLVSGDSIIIKQVHPLLDGIFVVLESVAANRFSIAIDQTQVDLLLQTPIKSSGTLFIMRSVRYLDIPSVVTASQENIWPSRTKIWVDSNESGQWEFYRKNDSWTFSKKISLEISNNLDYSGYGSAIAASPNKRFLAAGSPNKNSGRGRIHVLNFDNSSYKVNLIDSQNSNMTSLGFSLVNNNDYLISGSPKFQNDRGCAVVFVWNEQTKTHDLSQFILPPENEETNFFGYSIDVTSDSKNLYIGSPGNNTVYKYILVNQKTIVQFFEFLNGTIDYILKPSFVATNKVQYASVKIGDESLIPNIDYSINVGVLSLSQEKFSEYRNKTNYFGAAYTIEVKLSSHFEYSGIKFTNGSSSSNFGQSISVSQESDILLVGAPSDVLGDRYPSGSVYVFKSNQFIQRLSPSQLSIRANYGSSVSCSKDGSKLYIGSPNYSDSEVVGGAVFCYSKNNQTYKINQVLVGPRGELGQEFGYKIKMSANEKALLISSLSGSTKIIETYDGKNTIFDSNNTRFFQGQPGSGCVYLFEIFGSSQNGFINTKEFSNSQSKTGDRFGNAIEINENHIFIGADFSDSTAGQVGQIYEYLNETGLSSWVKTRSQDASVDISAINRICIFNKQNDEVLTELDYIDPIKGKILSIVDQDLDYRTSVDPAVYNAGSLYSNGKDLDHNWATFQIGKTWWDLSKVRYIDYEQSELSYRLKTWGQVFPGSDIHVCEWFESTVLPSIHVISGYPGVPYYEDDSRYCVVEYTNLQARTVTTKYYYWVRLLNKVPENSQRLMSVSEMESVILNPRAQNISYVGFLSKNSIGVFNSQEYISGSSTGLRIYYDKVLNSNLAHREYVLVRDGNSPTLMPSGIIDKMIDSLSGIDQIGQIVPDYLLTKESQLGALVRPRQTMILNKSEALRNVISFINSVLSTDSVVLQIQNNPEFKNSRLNLIDQLPQQFNYKVNYREELDYLDIKENDTVLIVNDQYYDGIWTLSKFNSKEYRVIKNQTFDTKKFWKLRPWYSSGFSSNSTVNYIVDQYSAIEKLSIKSGNIVKVLSLTGFELYYFDTPTSSRLIGLENGSIEFLESIWDNSQIGYDNTAVDNMGFDGNNSIEIRQILNALRYEILTNSLSGLFNQMIFVLVNYILSEQNRLDWMFKTSFISLTHTIRKLEQTPYLIKDNQDYYIDYINEVKPYRTKIRDYVLSYSNLDSAQLDTTDFDLPSEWDNDLKQYRSPNGEYPIKDGKLLTKPKYSQWLRNFYFNVESIKIVKSGSGFSSNPNINIVSVDGFGSGATAKASINNITGSLLAVQITNPGSGYLSAPRIVINGDGIGAELVAVMSNKKIRALSIVLKFDRVSYTTQVTEWIPNKSYTYGSLVSYQGRGYKAIANVPAYNLFNRSLFAPMLDSEYVSANDRVASIYQPNHQQPEKEVDSNGKINLSRLIPGVIRTANTDDGSPLGFGDDLSQPLGFKNNNQTQYITSGGQFIDSNLSYAPEELVPGIAYENLSIKVFTDWEEESKILAYRIVKNNNGNTDYYAMTTNRETVLTEDLNWDDTVIHVENASRLFTPDINNRVPGIIYIAGEKISYYAIDIVDNTISQFLRGVDRTSIPPVHLSGTPVEDSSSNLEIPTSIKTSTQSITFMKNIRTVLTSFSVSNNLDQVKNNLILRIGINQLTLGEYYTIVHDVRSNPLKAVISFTKIAKDRIVDGSLISVEYMQEYIWLNPTSGTITDGDGLVMSNTAQAKFLKNNPY